jgi:hypothetical protein
LVSTHLFLTCIVVWFYQTCSALQLFGQQSNSPLRPRPPDKNSCRTLVGLRYQESRLLLLGLRYSIFLLPPSALVNCESLLETGHTFPSRSERPKELLCFSSGPPIWTLETMQFWKPGTAAPGSSVDRATETEGGALLQSAPISTAFISLQEQRERLPIYKYSKALFSLLSRPSL